MNRLILALATAALFIAQFAPAVAQPNSSIQIFGVLCYSEEAVVKSAFAYAEGGIDLQNEVVDHMLNVTGECVRIREADALDGYFVYEGGVIGSKRVIGVGPDPHGPAQLYGLVQSDDPGPSTKHVPQEDEA
jgi:hypothetical protein